MLKLLIVDDEKIIRDGLTNVINWEGLNIEVCGAKSNAEEALEFCRSNMPDIIITDIKMPHMSGLDFIEALGDLRNDTKIIILSGFDDFEFSKRALKNNVFEYLLKPIKPADVTDAVVRARDTLLDERKARLDRAEYMNRIEKNIYIIRSHYLGLLASGIERSMDSSLMPDISDSEECCALAVCVSENKSIAYYMLLSEFQSDDSFYVFSGLDGDFGIFCRMSADNEKQIIEIKRKIEELLNSEVYIGVSDTFSGLCNLKKGWKEARIALDYRDITGGTQIIYYAVSDNGIKMLEKNEERLEEDIVDAVDRLDKNVLKPLIENFTAENQGVSIERLKRVLCKACLSICGYLIKIDEKPDRIIGDWKVVVDKIEEMTEFDVLCEFCVYFFSCVIDKIIDSKSLNSSPLVEKIVEYLDENFNKPFSLETLAQLVYLSPNYVSKVFRKETGKKLSDYIVEVRIEKAKELLKNPNIRAYEIGEKVGYTDARYFGDLFRKHTGFTLTEYRKTL